MDEQTSDRDPPPDPFARGDIPAVRPVPEADVPSVISPGEEPLAVLSADAAEHPAAYLGFGLFLGVAAAIYVALWFIPGEPRRVAMAGLQSLPFLGLALLAYQSGRYDGGRLITVLYWTILIGATGAVVWIATVAAVADPVG